ncbi:glycoside hydrolase family 15 protein [Sinomonas sp. JGH33]|uniref:Glycoside hydrolase family 15 protein n=1 Tax=Sinomonas terricola TaxID=3110330 RepID=A0ABU5TB04_9MICC|nr:glycoside hydrolase family 15 protein [Sinomonas sp. JGH33]MEA5456702.1 glycoside hydrolase family 15 protein [Sinomonas sp. JGH33]
MTTVPLSAPPDDLTDTEVARLRRLAARSHAVITAAQQPGGAYPACTSFSAYAGYAWFRDGAFTAEGISRYGDVASADAFHDWCARVLASRADAVRDLVRRAGTAEPPTVKEMLPTRFTYAGDAGQDPWWDFQTDGYGMWLWAVLAHARRHRRPLHAWLPAIETAVDYLCAFWDRPCYDWWEEHVEHRHVSTLGAIAGGLAAAADSGHLDPDRADAARRAVAGIRSLVAAEGTVDGHLAKWLGADAVDGSLPACIVPFGLVPVGSPVASATLAAVQRDLDVDGGVHRFRADVFYGGGQWPLLSALLGWNHAAAGDTASAWRHLRWIAAHADSHDELPEQVADDLLHPEHRQEWLDRWGPVAAPLLWSHGMYLILADELGLLDSRPQDFS